MNIATVKAHVSRLLEKLKFNNRVQIALLAHDVGDAWLTDGAVANHIRGYGPRPSAVPLLAFPVRQGSHGGAAGFGAIIVA
jgi:hypothetical protein